MARYRHHRSYSDVKGSVSTALVGGIFGLWVIMLVEYGVRLVITPDPPDYLKRRWVEPATVVVPVFQGWHVIGIEKMTLLVREGELRVEAILKHHSLFRVLIAAAATLFIGAWLVLLFEENAKGSNIHNYPDACGGPSSPLPLWATGTDFPLPRVGGRWP